MRTNLYDVVQSHWSPSSRNRCVLLFFLFICLHHASTTITTHTHTHDVARPDVIGKENKRTCTHMMCDVRPLTLTLPTSTADGCAKRVQVPRQVRSTHVPNKCPSHAIDYLGSAHTRTRAGVRTGSTAWWLSRDRHRPQRSKTPNRKTMMTISKRITGDMSTMRWDTREKS